MGGEAGRKLRHMASFPYLPHHLSWLCLTLWMNKPRTQISGLWPVVMWHCGYTKFINMTNIEIATNECGGLWRTVLLKKKILLYLNHSQDTSLCSFIQFSALSHWQGLFLENADWTSEAQNGFFCKSYHPHVSNWQLGASNQMEPGGSGRKGGY